jgi:hypothetical protein
VLAGGRLSLPGGGRQHTNQTGAKHPHKSV